MLQKRNILKITGESFVAWYKNLYIMLPFVFQAIASFIVVGIAMLIFFSMIGLSLTEYLSKTMTEDQLAQVILQKLTSAQTIVPIIILAIVAIIVYFLVISYFNSGSIGMSINYFRTKNKQGLKEMHIFGKKFFGRFFLLELLINIFFFIVLGIFFIILISSNFAVWSIILFIIIFFISMVLYFFVSLSNYILISEDTSVWHSITESFRIIAKNFWAFLGLCAIILIVSGLIQFIPIVGYILTILLVSPIFTFALALFVEERK